MLLLVEGISRYPLLAANLAGHADISSESASVASPGQSDDPSESANVVTRLVIYRSLHEVWVYQGTTKIKTYPVAVGRDGWETPTGDYQVRQLIKDPRWINPITGEAIASGDPKNPLGHYWIGFWTDGDKWIGLHGTPDPKSVGKAESHGCIRMYSQDIEELFPQVRKGTPVTVLE
jgi:lipoprotein-anchoring transpeptidase ErfK/SrfK